MFELDLLEHISAWKLCKLTVRKLIWVGGVKNSAAAWSAFLCAILTVIHLYILMYLWLNAFILGDFFLYIFFFICLASTAKNATQCGCRSDKNLFWPGFWGQNYSHCDCRKNIFHFLFCSWRKNRMPGLFISCPLTQNIGRITIALCEAQMNTSRFWIAEWSPRACPRQAAVASTPLAAALQLETTILRHGWWPSLCLSFPQTAKTDDELKRLYSWRGRRRRREKKDYHLLFKWNEVRQMVEEGPKACGRNPPARYLHHFSQRVTK